MSESQQTWINWARTLKHWGIDAGVASLLESIGSLSVLLVQFLYLSQPILAGIIPAHSTHSIAQILENPADRQAFISLLREASLSGTGA